MGTPKSGGQQGHSDPPHHGREMGGKDTWGPPEHRWGGKGPPEQRWGGQGHLKTPKPPKWGGRVSHPGTPRAPSWWGTRTPRTLKATRGGDKDPPRAPDHQCGVRGTKAPQDHPKHRNGVTGTPRDPQTPKDTLGPPDPHWGGTKPPRDPPKTQGKGHPDLHDGGDTLGPPKPLDGGGKATSGPTRWGVGGTPTSPPSSEVGGQGRPKTLSPPRWRWGVRTPRPPPSLEVFEEAPQAPLNPWGGPPSPNRPPRPQARFGGRRGH